MLIYYLKYPNVIFQQKITRQTKKQESMGQTQEEKQTRETIPKEIQMLDLLDNDFKPVTLNMSERKTYL